MEREERLASIAEAYYEGRTNQAGWANIRDRFPAEHRGEARIWYHYGYRDYMLEMESALTESNNRWAEAIHNA